MSHDKQRGMRLDQRIPLALVFALIIQAAATLIWAGSTIERLAQIERRQDTIGQLQERTARLEEKVDAILRSVTRIEGKLDKAASR